MRKILLSIAVLLLSVSTALADNPQKFSPEKSQADMEQFITKEAGLTADEAAKFFPLYREMQQKQRVVYKQIKEVWKEQPADEAAYKKAVEKRDEQEIQLKQILQSYHGKFFKVLPASKVYRVIIAEDKFHRNAFRQWGHRGKHEQPKKK